MFNTLIIYIAAPTTRPWLSGWRWMDGCILLLYLVYSVRVTNAKTKTQLQWSSVKKANKSAQLRIWNNWILLLVHTLTDSLTLEIYRFSVYNVFPFLDFFSVHRCTKLHLKPFYSFSRKPRCHPYLCVRGPQTCNSTNGDWRGSNLCCHSPCGGYPPSRHPVPHRISDSIWNSTACSQTCCISRDCASRRPL